MALGLVFAMSGGAWAAKKYVVQRIGQINPKVVKELKGKEGQPGPQGPAGPQGPKGEAGAAGKDGANGKDGAAGESVTVTALSKGDVHCGEGGTKLDAGGKEGFACTGSPWPAGGTLPKGATETGEWVLNQRLVGESFEFVQVAMSFPIPLAATLSEQQVHFILSKEGENEPEANWAASILSGECKGSFEKPEAKTGNLCVFSKALVIAKEGTFKVVEPGFKIENAESAGEGAGKSGAHLHALMVGAESGDLIGNGVWAVTG
jgi:hypothetical protein